MADPQKILLDSGPSKRSLWRLAEVLRCPQSYAFRYLAGRVGTSSAALARGTLMHCGVAHFYVRKQALQLGEDPDRYYRPIAAMEMLAAQRGATSILPECVEAVKAYAQRYADEPRQVLHVEEVIDVEITLPNGEIYRYTQRPDVILASTVGGRRRVFIQDLKTTSGAAADTIAQYALTLQMLSYRVIGPMMFGSDYDSTIIDAVGWADLSFARETLEPVPMMVRRFPQIIQDAEETIARLTASGRPFDNWPRVANGENCTTKYGKCAFWDACAWGAEELVKLHHRGMKVKLKWGK